MKIQSINITVEGLSSLHLLDDDGQQYIVSAPAAFIAQFAVLSGEEVLFSIVPKPTE